MTLDEHQSPAEAVVTLSAVGNAVGGTVALDSNGDVVFMPEADFNRTSGFDYTVADGQGGTFTQHVAVMVAPVNDAPNRASASCASATSRWTPMCVCSP